jgi:SEC-C motif-containing protein
MAAPSSAARSPRDCPCFSGQRYTACCAPLHRGEREASTPVVLMRSRYAAFALGLGDYLVRTLSRDHADLEVPREALLRELSQARQRRRFMGLQILHERVDGDEGEVLFFARIFEKGVDGSFVELSQFRREDAAWRYASGILVPRADLPGPLEALTPADLFGLRTRA